MFETPKSSISQERFAAAPIDFETVEQRNAWLDERLDPEHTLPTISLVPDSERGRISHMLIVAGDDQTQKVAIGKCTLEGGNRIAPEVKHVSWVELEDKYRGKGYGTATYLTLMKNLPLGESMKSDSILSRDSYDLWRSLEAKGVAVSNKPDEEVYDALDGDEPTSVRFRTLFGESNEQLLALKIHQELADKIRAQQLESLANSKKQNGFFHRFLGKMGLH